MPTYAEIQEQIKHLQAQAEQLRQIEIQEAISDINSKIALYGIIQKDLTFPDSPEPQVKAGSKQPKNKLPPKYRNKETGEEWSGRGIQPKWLKNAITEGKILNDFMIKS